VGVVHKKFKAKGKGAHESQRVAGVSRERTGPWGQHGSKAKGGGAPGN
jgi:hypothetical protein